jgi:quercetin dioxygenase-like cupin family protein
MGLLALVLASQAGQAADEQGVRFISAAQVQKAFEKGQPLIETAGYKIHASRREEPGMAEVHVSDTDIIYVLEGSASIETGGRVIAGATTGPGEIRGTSIDGGSERRLVKGDVMVVPNGVPHRFTQVDAPFLYYVVKATSNAGGTR